MAHLHIQTLNVMFYLLSHISDFFSLSTSDVVKQYLKCLICVLVHMCLLVLRTASPLMLGLGSCREAFCLSFGAASCAFVILSSVCSSKADTHTHTLSRMHIHTLIFFPLRHSTDSHTNTIGYRDVHTKYKHIKHARMPHPCSVQSVLCAHALSLFPQLILAYSCEKHLCLVCPVSLHVHVLTWLMVCTVSGINSVCLSVCDQLGSPLCVLLCNAKLQALFHAASTPLRVLHCTVHAPVHCSNRMLFIDLPHKDK